MDKSTSIVVGFWRRFFADFLDAIFLAIPGFGIGYLFRYTLSNLGSQALWIGLVCCLLYYGLQHAQFGRGQTIGKRLLGIQVLRRDGKYLSLGKSFLRYLVVAFVFYNGLYGSFINFLPPSAMMAVGSIFLLVVIWAFLACFIMIPFHPLKRGLHDIVSGSVVVFKDTFDNEALDNMEDPDKVKRAMILLSAISLIFVGIFTFSLMKLTDGLSGDLGKLVEIQRFLSTEYSVPQVNSNIVNGKAESLSIVVFIPMASFEDKTRKEQIRHDVLNKVNANFNGLEQYGKLRVVISSGFNIGIASLSFND